MIVFQIDSSKGVDLAFKEIIKILNSVLIFLKPRLNGFYLVSEPGIILFTAEVSLHKKPMKVSVGPV